MTTTEAPRPKGPPAGGTTDLRLYLLALLATAYVSVWWALASRAPRSTDEPLPEPGGSSTAATWYEDLPPAQRPPVQLPAGWQIVERADWSNPALRAARPTPVRYAPARRARIRTRSS